MSDLVIFDNIYIPSLFESHGVLKSDFGFRKRCARKHKTRFCSNISKIKTIELSSSKTQLSLLLIAILKHLNCKYEMSLLFDRV